MSWRLRRLRCLQCFRCLPMQIQTMLNSKQLIRYLFNNSHKIYLLLFLVSVSHVFTQIKSKSFSLFIFVSLSFTLSLHLHNVLHSFWLRFRFVLNALIIYLFCPQSAINSVSDAIDFSDDRMWVAVIISQKGSMRNSLDSILPSFLELADPSLKILPCV